MGLIGLIGLILATEPNASAQTNAPADASTTSATTDATAPALAVPPTISTNADVAPSSGSPISITPPSNISGGQAAPANAPDPSIEDIRPPFFFLHSWFWLWIALAVLVAIALIILLIFWLKPNRQLSAKSAYELALEKLEQARALLQEENPVPYAVFVSETIRSYLGQRFQSPSTRRTTDEFLRQMEADPTTPLAGYRDLLRDFLQSCDLVKFARYQPALNELEQVQQRAYTFVTATKPEPVSAAANGKLVST